MISLTDTTRLAYVIYRALFKDLNIDIDVDQVVNLSANDSYARNVVNDNGDNFLFIYRKTFIIKSLALASM